MLFTNKMLFAYDNLDEEVEYMRSLIEGSYSNYAEFLSSVNESPKNFFQEGQNQHTHDFIDKTNTLKDTLQALFNLPFQKKNQEKYQLEDTISLAISKYENDFDAVILTLKERGNYDFGKISEIRKLSDQLNISISLTNDPNLITHLINLKNFEAAYLYNGKISAYYDLTELLNSLSYYTFSDETDFLLVESIQALTAQYLSKLENLELIFIRLGSESRKSGAVNQFEKSYDQLSSVLEYVVSYLEKTTNTIRKLIWIVAFIVLIGVVMLYIVSIVNFGKKVRNPLDLLIAFTYNLSKGKLNQEKIPDNLPYEFNQLGEYSNNMFDFLIEKKDFVDDLLKQKFKAEIKLQGRNDTFGKTLLALKENMRKTRDEQVRYGVENEHRRYLNEGVAKFADILRSSSNDMTMLGDMFIRELVKYLKAIQGGLFLVDEENENKLKLVATFAFNRKKYINKTIGIGEGLVGACAMEKQSINLTEIPDNYIEITSGLGDAAPNNLLLLPVLQENTLMGVVEIASMDKFEDVQIELGESIAGSLAATIIATRTNTKTTELLAKSQQQAAEMAEQEEEMRQNLEELKATQEESQRREEELEGILSSIDQAFYVVEYDTEGIVSKVNQKVLDLLGRKMDDIIGKSHQQVFGKGAKADSLLFANIAEGNSVELAENITINKKPTEIKNTFSPIQSKSGETLRILNIMTINT